jgi:hypothetical protein
MNSSVASATASLPAGLSFWRLPQVVRMKSSGHKTDSTERRYKIVDVDDMNMAKSLMGEADEGIRNCSGNCSGFAKTGETRRYTAKRRISYLALHDTRRYSVFWLEVLAGVISWGFKSPSPHQRISSLASHRSFSQD